MVVWLSITGNCFNIPSPLSDMHTTMPPNSDVRPVTANLPATLAKWRGYNTTPRLAVWDPLRDWFASQGLHFFNHAPESTVVKPQVNELRAHDGTYSTHYNPPNISHEHRVCEHTSLHPACVDVNCREPFIVLLELPMGVMFSFA
jgi:hypothetical protein